MIPATPEEQRQLYELQEIDTAIRLLQHRRTNLPEQKALDENAETLSKITAEYAQRRERLETLELQQKRHEDEVAVVESRRKSEDNRMYSGLITSEKELEALRGEVTSLRNRKRDLEDALLEIMEEREELDGAVAALKDRHTELSTQVDALAAARDEAATEIDAELTERRTARGDAAKVLSEEIRKHYEDLLHRKAGLAVASLDGTTCTGCRLQLTVIELEELRETTQRGIAKCAQCGRILVPR